MAPMLREFVAEDGWLLIGIVTFALISLAGIAGLEALAGVIVIIGWFLLTPIFLFWGDEMATLLFGEESSESTLEPREAEPDALEELKRRYAAGEIDDAEFERRLERLVAVDDLPDDLFDGATTADSSREFDLGSVDDGRNREPERER
ncbi:SHOCT domain-containing protein [Natronolimnohabitans innermongolicus]|uniref:SHOCT domain-containing protein n=1 Tax=Natronolimnohabitans innermongolicus JCM 12255 TaxID=1227499 RepID=L9WIK7_9EURY|nr:SHOCT domain-containing protein [Natronolimnohabitans innermongolicus]ELY49335.1 hypothetical protein C493_20731 [Natronolimnohabitans innermongolicus JCM 12255]